MRSYKTIAFVGVSLCVAAATAAHGQSAFSNEVMSLNPIAYWPLQETVQPPAAYVENNNGSLGASGTMYYSTNSITIIKNLVGPSTMPGSRAKGFTGSPAYALVPTTDNRVSLPPGGPFSVEAWVSPNEIGNYQAMLSHTGTIPGGGNNAASYKAGWMFGQNYVPLQDDGSGTTSGALYGWSFTVFNGQGIFGGATAIAPIAYQTNTWYHLVGVYDGTNCRVYVNGTLASPADLGVSMPAGTSFLPDTWDPLQVASSRGVGANAWNGSISEISIYTNALSSLQVSNHFYQGTVSGSFGSYEAAVTGDNPYMYWHMNAGVYFPPDPGSLPAAGNYGSGAANITNLTILAADGYVSPTAVYQVGTLPGVAGPAYAGFGSPSYACAFNGLTGSVDAGYELALDPTGSATPLSVIGWFKGNPCDDNGRANMIVSHSDSSWHMKISNGSSIWDDGSGQDVTAPPVNVNDGRWHMFAGTYNPANSNNTIYMDGAVSTTVQTNRSIAGKTNLDVNIGGAPDHIAVAAGAQQNFAGSVAHIAYFNYALSQAQIQSLYNSAQPPPYILTNPASISGIVSGGATATFNVSAEGAAPLSYTWYYTNSGTLTQLPGDTNSLTLNGVADANSGSYYVVVGNGYGSVTSSVASLHVSSEPVVISQIGSGTLQLYEGQNFTFSVTAVGSNLTYQWYTNGVADTSAGTSSSYTVNNAQLSMSGTTYQVAVSNALDDISNNLTTLTVISLPTSLTAGGTYGSNILALNPTAYWPMHETAPGVQGDSEANLGTLGAAGTAYYADWDPNNISNLVEMNRQIPGAIANDPDTALEFKRAPAGYMTVPHSSPLATIKPPFSVETWVNPTAIANNPYQVIIGQGGGTGLNGGSALGGFALEYGGSNSKTNCFSLALWNGNAGGNDELETQSIYPPGTQWYHVVATFDGTNIVIYVNGQPSANYQSGTTTASMNSDSWSPLCVGGGRWGTGGPTQPYSGPIDEVAIYTNVLSAARVSTHYTDGTSGGSGTYKADVLQDSPLLYYRMDAPAYTQPPRSTWPILTNYGSLALNGVYEPGANPGSATASISLLGDAAVTPLNGNGVFADAGIAPALNPQGYTSFSYTAFFRGYPGDDRSFEGIMSANDASWRSSINNAGKVQAHGTADITSTNVYNDGNWHQMVLTYQGNPTAGTGTNLLYVDGVLAATNNTTSTNNPASDPGPEVLLGNENGFWIFQSGQTGNTGVERCLSGSVCEAAFFNGQVLSAAQATQLYNAAGVAPFFATQPASAKVNEGSAFTNTVAASGSDAGAITYQWYNNGSALSDTGGYTGSATASLVMNPVTGSMASSDYYAVASSIFGSVTSTPASLVVASNPVIVSSSPSVQNVTLLGSSTVAFSVVASGATPLTYYWTSNSVVVQSGTSNTFTIKNVTAGAAGTYSVLVSNFLGTATTNWTLNIVPVAGNFVPAVVALKPIGFWLMNEPGDGTDLSNGVVCHDYIGGNNGVYENTVLGLPGYDWGDMAIGIYDTNTAAGFGTQGPNSCAYNISNIVVSSSTSAEFTVQAWVQATAIMPTSLNTPGIVGKGLYNHEEFALDCGTHVTTGPVTGDAYRFSIRNSAETQIDAGSTVVAGSDTNWHFVVGVCDQVHNASYLYIDGTNAAHNTIVAGAGEDNASDIYPVMIGSRTSTTYDPTLMNEQFSGNIADVAIFNVALTSNQILSEFYAAGIAPIFISEPVGTNIISQGATESISASVEGTPPLSYQWLDENSNPIIGATNTTLIISNISTNNTFTLQVSNAYGITLSSNSMLSVITGPPVVEQDIEPLAAAAVAGSTVTFTAAVAGSQPITYGWQFDGAPVANSGRISGANSSTLVINDAQVGDAGTYQLFMTNTLGTNLTSQATLDIIPFLSFNNGGIGWHTQATVGSSLAWLSSNQLQLTANLGSEASAAFFDAPVYIGAFEASFTYQVPTGPGSSADGATFCVQNDPRGAAAIGGGGGSLAVNNITPSFELELNIYAANSIGGVGASWNTNGLVGPVLPTTPVIINSGDSIQVDVTYVGGLASATFTDTNAGASFTFSTNVNVPAVVGASTAYVGFTGADGAVKSTQIISDFQFASLLPLSVQHTGGNLIFSWPASSGAYELQTSPAIGRAANWTTVATPQTFGNGQIQVTISATAGADAFYRLVSQ